MIRGAALRRGSGHPPAISVFLQSKKHALLTDSTRSNLLTLTARFTRLQKHNHLSQICAFNTADEQLGREILDFMRQGR
jgi:hypothetical protein